MGYFIAYTLVFLFGATPFFEGVAIIPIGTVAGLDPFLTAIIALIGNVITVLLIIVFIEHINAWLDRRRKKKGKPEKTKKNERAQRVFTKYGLPGLCLIGPTFGSHLTALIGMSLSGSKSRTAFWMILSLTLWCTAIAFLSLYGIGYLIEDNETSNMIRNFIESYN
ncbi:small multi-drug export protein [Alkalicoccobacillus murimartini]|uniref:Membrane protein n=1 Tax=Alkalicoccobacillus murimartini TaxID=171685 RepID=A0ABT9YG70_9BACI|nr:small multi-drug export protein [Alkalicoccobacillus murimartini]MDQ0206837.1 putative membrane protein [Alkalicoccobacillus murimartini]